MDIRVTQQFDERYHREFFAEWLAHRSTWRKYEAPLGLAALLLAAAGMLLLPEYRSTLIFLALFGVLTLGGFYWQRHQWLSARRASGMNGKSATMHFTEAEIYSKGPFTENHLQWNFFREAVATPKGVFLIPENGVSVYLQRKNFSQAIDLDRIVDRINAPSPAE